MKTNIEMMQNIITENFHWRKSNRHLTVVAEIAVMLVLFAELLLLVILLQ